MSKPKHPRHAKMAHAFALPLKIMLPRYDQMQSHIVDSDGPDNKGHLTHICLCEDEDHQEQAAQIVRAVNAHDDLVGALRFILAFYEPGQRTLDTEAWKRAEAAGRAALAKAEAQP